MDRDGRRTSETEQSFCKGPCRPDGTKKDTDTNPDKKIPREKRVSQWEVLMRKFSEAHREVCQAVDIPRVKRAEKTFPTGSSYTGTWDVLGMSGYGTYTFPNGVIYEGEFDDGTFHGRGELRYPSGAVLTGRWVRGEMMDRTLVFPDGLQYSESDWQYCVTPDRRFTVERDKGLKPAGQSHLTAEPPPRAIPPGCYDTGDGFYDPTTKAVYSPTDSTRIIRKPSVREQNWIINNCRTNPMGPLGPQPALYEEWSKPNVEPQVEESAMNSSHTLFSIGTSVSRPFKWADDKKSEVAFLYLRGDSTSSSSLSD